MKLHKYEETLERMILLLNITLNHQ